MRLLCEAGIVDAALSHLPNWLKTTAAFVTTLAAVVTGLGLLGRKARELWKRGRHVVDVLFGLARLAERELSPNGGGSLKDAAHRAEEASKVAASTAAEALQLNKANSTHILELRQGQKVTHKRMYAIEREQGAQRHLFSRYVKHEAAQDLNHSSLAAELAAREGG